MVALAFGLYAAGTMIALTAFSSWSDHVGRRPALITGLLLSAPNVLVVLVARVLGGLDAGIAVAAVAIQVSGAQPSTITVL